MAASRNNSISECSIGWRLLRPYTVGVNLAIDFDEQIAPAGFARIICTRRSRCHRRADNKACELGNPMIIRRRMQRWKLSHPIDVDRKKPKNCLAGHVVETFGSDH